MIYIASPYSHPIDAVRIQRYKQVREFTDRLIKLGFVAFSPIAYCHPIAERIGHATDAKTWFRFNMSMLRRAEAMYVLRLQGWEQSVGLQQELTMCRALDIVVVHYRANGTLDSTADNYTMTQRFAPESV